MTDIVERLRIWPAADGMDGLSSLYVHGLVNEAADEIERLRRDCAVDVSELYREIERLQAHIDTLVQERDAERMTYNDAIARHLAEIERLRSLTRGKP